MAKTFTIMKDEVASMCLDTTTTFKTLAGGWINDALQDAKRRFYWQDSIENNYTFESVVGTSKYTYPTDFLREYKLTNIATGKEIECWDVRRWWKERGGNYQNDALDSGTPDKYIILREEGKIQLDPKPVAAETYQFVYQKEITDLANDSDVSAITQLDSYLIWRATGMGFAYYKQYDKADWWMQKAEMELVKISGFHNSTIEQEYKRYPGRTKSYRWLRRLVGGNSYDSI
jgi:hypothetical protein